MKYLQRVLEIIADGTPGGGTTHVLQILRGLRRKYSLNLITQDRSYLLNEARSLGIPAAGTDFFRSRFDMCVPLNLRRMVRKFDPQLVHVHGGRAGFFHALAGTHRPTVYTAHGYNFLHEMHEGFWLRLPAIKAESLTNFFARRVILVSNHEARVALAYNLLRDPSKSLVIHNGIPLEEIPQATPKEIKHIGFIGRLEREKDPLLFLETVERLPEYNATIIGGGVLQAQVETYVRRRGLDRVHVKGALPYPETLKALSEFGVLVITSISEAFGIVAVEAMWSGVPVVATSVGGLTEIIEDGRSGLLVDSRSASDLAHAVMRISEDNTLRRHMIDNARTQVADLFSEERMLSSIDAVYREVALP